MPPIIISGAQIVCTFGTVPSFLTVLPQNRVTCYGSPSANITDNKAFVNIPSFAMCISLANPAVASATAAAKGVLTPYPCTPKTATPWVPGVPQVTIGGKPALNNNCTLNCAYGGVISILDPGQRQVNG